MLRNYDGLGDGDRQHRHVGRHRRRARRARRSVRRSRSRTLAAKLELRVSDEHGLLLDPDARPGAPVRADRSRPGRPGHQHPAHLDAERRRPTCTGYNVYRALTSGGPFTRSTPCRPTASPYYLDAGLPPLTRYYYQVTAVDSLGQRVARVSAVDRGEHEPAAPHRVPDRDGRRARSRRSRSTICIAGVPARHRRRRGRALRVARRRHGTGRRRRRRRRPAATSPRAAPYYAAAPSIADLDGDGVKEIIGVALGLDRRRVRVRSSGQRQAGLAAAIADPVWSSARDRATSTTTARRRWCSARTATSFYAFRANGTEWIDGDTNPATHRRVQGAGQLRSTSARRRSPTSTTTA